MKFCLLFSGLLMASCSGSNEKREAESESGTKIAECQSEVYSIHKSEFFGGDAYLIAPNLIPKDVSQICQTSTTDDTEKMKPICDWAFGKMNIPEGNFENADFREIWSGDAARLMTSKLNKIACGKSNEGTGGSMALL